MDSLPSGLRTAWTSTTQTPIIAIDTRKWNATIHGFRSVSTVIPPITAWAGIPSPMIADSRIARRSPDRRATRKQAIAIMASTNVSVRLPNSIAPCRPRVPWGTYDSSVQRGQVGQPRPEPVRRTAPPVTTMAMLATRFATASRLNHNPVVESVGVTTFTPT